MTTTTKNDDKAWLLGLGALALLLFGRRQGDIYGMGGAGVGGDALPVVVTPPPTTTTQPTGPASTPYATDYFLLPQQQPGAPLIRSVTESTGQIVPLGPLYLSGVIRNAGPDSYAAHVGIPGAQGSGFKLGDNPRLSQPADTLPAPTPLTAPTTLAPTSGLPLGGTLETRLARRAPTPTPWDRYKSGDVSFLGALRDARANSDALMQARNVQAAPALPDWLIPGIGKAPAFITNLARSAPRGTTLAASGAALIGTTQAAPIASGSSTPRGGTTDIRKARRSSGGSSSKKTSNNVNATAASQAAIAKAAAVKAPAPPPAPGAVKARGGWYIP